MADNYIERQQEQYDARKAAWKQAQKYGKKKLTAVRPVESESPTPMASKSDGSKKKSICNWRSRRNWQSNSRSFLPGWKSSCLL